MAAAVAMLTAVIVLMLLPVVVVIVAVPDGAEITGVIALASVTTLVVKVAQRPAAMRPVVDG